jgi:cysteinyl-tRNA synthetase
MTAVKFHNTPTSEVEEFKPQQENEVLLYTCGPTVYDNPHIGNWVSYIYWDVLVRVLIANEYNVKRVMNITDVGHLSSDADEGEDKLEKGARREGKTAWDIAQKYTDAFLEGMRQLNLIKPEFIAKATDYIPQQIELLQKLQDKGYTYTIDDGIYFDTSKFPTYANFAHLDIEEQKAGARVSFNEQKRNISDFALWKFTPRNEKRDMEWELEGRMGFPGWHLECSAIALSILGDTLDIHTGGIDHVPVHHTNEIAQSEAATGKKFCNYWLHNNHLKIDGTKISKSLSNGYTLEDLKSKGFSPLDFKMLVLQSNYRHEGNFTFDNLQSAKNRLDNWRNIAALRHQMHDTIISDIEQNNDHNTLSLYATSQAIIEVLNNDLNTPEALKIIDDAFSKITSKSLARINQHSLVQVLTTIDEVLGLQLIQNSPDISDKQKQLIIKRNEARNNKDWEESDRIRKLLADTGISIRDTEKSSTWEYKL